MGAQLVPIGMLTLCWKTQLSNTTNMLSIKKLKFLKMSDSEYFLLELKGFSQERSCDL